MVPLVLRVLKVLKESMVTLASRALKVKKENAVILVSRGLMERKVIQVCKALLVTKGCVVILGKGVRKEIMVFQEKLARRA